MERVLSGMVGGGLCLGYVVRRYFIPEIAEQIGEMTQDDIKQWFQFIGYGNPKAPVWFIGIEEGGDPSDGGPDPSLSTMEVGGHTVRWDASVDIGPKPSRAWTVPFHIVEGLGCEGKLWDQVLLSNVCPLPRNNIKMHHAALDANAYRQRVVKERVPMLLEAARELGVKVLVFHGKAGWEKHGVQDAVAPPGIWRVYPNIPRVLVSEDTNPRVILTATFTRHRWFPDSSRDALMMKLAEWKSDEERGW